MARVSTLPRIAATGAALNEAFALLTVDEAGARASFDRCAGSPSAKGDRATLKLCAAGQLLAIAIEFADFRGSHEAMVRFREGPDREAFADPLQRARIDAAALALASMTDLNDDEAADRGDCEARLHAFLLDDSIRDASLSDDERVLLAKVLIDALGQGYDNLRIGRLIALVQEHLQSGNVAPIWQARWWLLMLLHHDWVGNGEAARTSRERAELLIDRHGLLAPRFALNCIQMAKVLVEDDLIEADRLYIELESLMPQVRAGILPHGLRAQARVLMRRGHYREALDKLELLLGICDDVEVPMRDQGAYRTLFAQCLVGAGHFEKALAVMAEARMHQSGSQRDMLDAMTATILAAQALDLESADRHARVGEAMRLCSRVGHSRFMLPLPHWAARLAEAALDSGFEVEFVCSAIRLQRLQPNDLAREDWPWRLRVYAIGELRVLRDGEPLRMSGKAQRKPLELLALLASHPSGPIGIEKVVDQLWPSLEANSPRASFDMALSRLRKLIDLPNAILVADGTVGLDPAQSWTDVGAFERNWDLLFPLAARLPANRIDTTPGGHSEVQTDRLAERAISLYRDRLLGSEDVRGIVQTARERLAMKFARLVEKRGARLEAHGQWQAAILLYEQGLARDALSERLYRGLMRVYLHLGEHAEVLRTFRRCHQLLASALGVEPSAETRQLNEVASQHS